MKYMPTTNEIYKADLAEYSYLIYEKFLHKVFLDSNIDVPERHQILLYCFLHRGISYSQLTTLFGNSIQKKKSTTMVIKRLRDNDYLISLKNLKTLNNNYGDSSENTYLITAAGVNYCSQLLLNLFPEFMPMENLTTSEHKFTLKEILDYLSIRCMSNIPAYWNHYLAARDVNTFLLSSSFSNIDYSYETEVGISESGIPATLYSRALLGVGKLNYPVRCDAMLTYPLSKENCSMRFFLEQDTGKQRSALLIDKVNNYISYYLGTNSFSPTTSLLFCLNTKVDEDKREFAAVKGGYGTKEYYYSFALECAFDLLSINLPGGLSCQTVGEAIAYLREMERDERLSPSLNQLLTYFSGAAAINETMSLTMLKKQYYNNRNEITEKRAVILAGLHLQKYMSRRSLLHRSLDPIIGLEDYFLKGFSIYTVPNYDFDGTFPYLLPEMFQFRNKLKRMFVSLNMIDSKTIPNYEPFYTIVENEIVMRNSYYFQEENLHIIIENITDDLGGLYRVRKLLNQVSLPSSLISSKLLCLCDNLTLDAVKEIYLDTIMGKKLSLRCGSSCKKDDFEVLFATYDTIRSSGSLFTFSSDGSIVYKYN
jgi:hypothetical protein